ncbi:MAG: rRNA adenine N-6-methyltransferase family protein [Patescibacteria group bacterium]|jgi:16S rRNA A1518/A1519 N6-dimethyltransferase RsmA/KsgA/DIM1 with predicted DNA glycosylase/AP lyase activity
MSIYIVLLLVILVIFIFSSKTLSPIPYFPSQPIDIPLIIKALNLKNDQTLIDLGAGDGIVIFKAASESLRKKINTKFIAVEINPILIMILYVRRLFHPNRKNIKIVHDDIFKMDFNSLTRQPVNSLTFYLYISPWFLEKVIKNCKLKIKNFDVVSYMYPIKSLKKNEKIIHGKNKIFIY